MQYVSNNTELSSHEETRCQFNGSTGVIKLGIDVHQQFYTVVVQEGGSNPKPPQRFRKEAFLHWAARLKQLGAAVHAVYEACGFGFGLQRQLSALGITCHVVCPQQLDEHNRRVKTDSLDAKALCLKLDRFVQGNKDALDHSATAVASTNRSKSRWKNKTSEQQGRGSAPSRTFNRDQQSYELTTTYTTFAPQHLTSYIGVRCFHSPLIHRMNPGRSSSRFYRIRKSRQMCLRVHRKRTRRKRDRG